MTAWPPKQDDSIENITNAFRRKFSGHFQEDASLTYDDYFYRSPRGRPPSAGRALLFEAIEARTARGERVNDRLLMEEKTRLLEETKDPKTRRELQQAVNASTRNNFHNRFRGMELDAKRCCEALCEGAFEAAAQIYVRLTSSEFARMSKILTGISQHD